MIEDLIHGPKSSAERTEKLPLGRAVSGPNRFKVYISKLNAQARKAENNLFSKVNFFFTGYTDKLNVVQLKNVLHKNGGRTSYAFSALETTHVVCTSLCGSKLQYFVNRIIGGNCNKVIHIVNPNWIINSVKGKRLLPETDFQLESVKKHLLTHNIKHYFHKEVPLSPDIDVTDDTSNLHADNLPVVLDGATIVKEFDASFGSDKSLLASSGSPTNTGLNGDSRPSFTVHYPLLQTRRSASSSFKSDPVNNTRNRRKEAEETNNLLGQIRSKTLKEKRKVLITSIQKQGDSLQPIPHASRQTINMATITKSSCLLAQHLPIKRTALETNNDRTSSKLPGHIMPLGSVVPLATIQYHKHTSVLPVFAPKQRQWNDRNLRSEGVWTSNPANM